MQDEPGNIMKKSFFFLAHEIGVFFLSLAFTYFFSLLKFQKIPSKMERKNSDDFLSLGLPSFPATFSSSFQLTMSLRSFISVRFLFAGISVFVCSDLFPYCFPKSEKMRKRNQRWDKNTKRREKRLPKKGEIYRLNPVL